MMAHQVPGRPTPVHLNRVQRQAPPAGIWNDAFGAPSSLIADGENALGLVFTPLIRHELALELAPNTVAPEGMRCHELPEYSKFLRKSWLFGTERQLPTWRRAN
jgi:hypothetical protein